MYEILMGLPLFNGVSRERMTEIVGNTKFHFLKYLEGETIIAAGNPCTHIMFIISGSARVSITNVTGRFTVSQTLEAPDVISPEYLFGMSSTYPCSVVANEPVGILQIDKNDYLHILNSDRVFLYNFLNTLSTKAQKGVEGILALTTGALDQRLAYWIIALTQRSGKNITMTCKTRDLYSLFGVQRSSFMATLDAMKEQGYIDYEPGVIYIKSRKGLLDILNTSPD
ncbi:MAG: Crp/Fnr family transcriptional regulator [Muribaculaceae bacterium]|nr:Crp/Fnr family transcriptional regulator [Muribaculaceae bacterium]MDE6831812.1 Crp/Fnr family transcriptional regulator [Muribaculaceae bacterium]